MSAFLTNEAIAAGARARAAERRAQLHRLAGGVIAALALLLILVTLRPFGPPDEPARSLSEGDPVNQYGFLAAGALVAFGFSTLVRPAVLLKLAGPVLLAVLALIVLAVANTPIPSDTARSALLTVIGMAVALAVVVLPASEADFRRILLGSTLSVLALAYLSVLLVPDLAIHQASGPEAAHAGLWRGHYTHKNVAGPVMSVLALAGIYLWRSGHRLAGPVITMLAAFFVVQTGSKTTLAFLPLSVLIVMMRPLFGRAWLVVAVAWAVLAAAFLMTVGTVLFPPMADLVARLPGDPTFTGRTAIWNFALDAIAQKPLSGYGFANFWNTDVVTGSEISIEALWDVRGIGSGHSNFIDMPLNFGIPGGLLILYAFLFAPGFDYCRSQRRAENALIADFFMTIIIFMSFTSLMESFLFNRVQTFWLLIVMAVFGLRLTARTSVREQ